MAIYKDGGTTVAYQKRKFRKLIPFMAAVLLAAFACFGAFWYIRRTTQAPAPVSTKVVNKGFFDPLTTYQSDYFSFRAQDGWRLIDSESNLPNKFVYRLLLNETYVEQELRVYVNQKADDERVTYVAPVTTANQALLLAARQSEHCRTLLPNNPPADNPITLQFELASFRCWRDNTLAIVGASEVGGDSYLTLPRNDGSEAEYFIYYRDNRYSNNPVDFQNILKSFESR